MGVVDEELRDEAAATVDELAEHLAEVFAAVPGGVYLYLDPTHKVCNERLAEILGTTVEEWRSLENFRDTFVDVADRQPYCDTYERVVHGLDWPDTYNFRAVRKDGRSFDAEATIVPLTFRGHKFAYHFVRPLQQLASGVQASGIVQRFQDAWNDHDLDGMAALMTNDSVFESTSPAPDGERVEGLSSVLAFWKRFFQDNPKALIHVEELFSVEDRATMRWRYQWGSGPEHVRGVDVYRLRNGKISEKLSYVKG